MVMATSAEPICPMASGIQVGKSHDLADVLAEAIDGLARRDRAWRIAAACEQAREQVTVHQHDAGQPEGHAKPIGANGREQPGKLHPDEQRDEQPQAHLGGLSAGD